MRITVIIIGAIIVLATIIIVMVISPPSKDYSIDVDAIRDEQSLFVSARVILTNSGRQSLTDVLVDYGNRSEIIKMIQPGEKIYLSPPEGSRLDVVKISDSRGVNVTKEYRKPIKLPSMIGS
jgi:hypothetical protein